MSTYVIDEAKSATQTLNGSNDLMTITRNGNIGVYGDTSVGLYEQTGCSGNTIKVYGQISAAPGDQPDRSTGILIAGNNTHLIIGASAFVTGEIALNITGANVTVETTVM